MALDLKMWICHLKLYSPQGVSDYRYKIAGIYLTTHDSWDVLGINPSYSSYKDDLVSKMILNHNTQIREASRDTN